MSMLMLKKYAKHAVDLLSRSLKYYIMLID